jgi:two-component system, OmpR family, alkaline phosphatase synthesis response regulator PhoP
MPRILVVEDDEHLGRGIELHLAKEGFEVARARRGELAVAMATRQAFDLITLDVMLPGMTGLDVCRELRRQGVDTPVIMLTARTEEVDRIVGLEIGADDYVTKPFSARELVARIKARLRRDGGRPDDTTRIRFGRLEVDLSRYVALRDGVPIELTAREFDILRLLIRNRGEIVSRNRILDEVWPAESSLSPRTVDTHILHLRKKVEDDAAAPRHIQSVYGEGYRFVG